MSRPQAVGAPAPVGVPRPSSAVIEAVRSSCLAVADRPVQLAEVFYAHLFAMAPQLRPMFPPDMTGQMQKMTDTLLGAIGQVDTADPTELVNALRRLGADHRTRYRVEPEHYDYIGHALTRAVRDVAGDAYSGSLSSAWIALYQWVAAHMTAGADAAEREAAHQAIAMPHPRVAYEDDREPATQEILNIASMIER